VVAADADEGILDRLGCSCAGMSEKYFFRCGRFI
jgi:hypothetical protein